MQQIHEMCSRAIWLEKGQVQAQGDVSAVLDQYRDRVMAHDEVQMVKAEREQMEAAAQEPAEEEPKEQEEAPWRWGSHEVEIVSVEMLDEAGEEQRILTTGDTLRVRIHYLAHEPIEAPKFGLAIFHNSGFHISGPNNVVGDCPIPRIEGAGFVDYVVENLPLLPGTYLVTAAIHDLEGKHTYEHIHQKFTFRVRSKGEGETFGSFYMPSTWYWNPAVEEES
jgi:lipopolysaccharide transport system ATP-binding protein